MCGVFTQAVVENDEVALKEALLQLKNLEDFTSTMLIKGFQ